MEDTLPNTNQGLPQESRSRVLVDIIKPIFLLSFGLVALLLVGTNAQLPKGMRLLAVQSGSMSPTIKAGDLILSLPQSDYTIGNIIVFVKPEGTLVTHRVVEVIQEDGQKFFATKGDANEGADSDLVAQTNIVGQVRIAAPFLGRFVNFTKTSLGFVLLIVLPSMYIIFSELLTIRDEVASSQKKGISSPPMLILALLMLGLLSFSQATYASFTDLGLSEDNDFAAGTTFSSLFTSPDYNCTDGATSPEDSFGTVNFSFSGNDVNLHIILAEASPSANYDVTVQQDPNDCPHTPPQFEDGITTDSNGNAIEDFTVGRISGATNFWVAVTKVDHELRSQAISE